MLPPKEKNFYDLLNCAVTSSASQITTEFWTEYRLLAKETHPDKKEGSKDLFMKINEAYEVLRDPLTRRDYDSWLSSDLQISYENYKELNAGPTIHWNNARKQESLSGSAKPAPITPKRVSSKNGSRFSPAPPGSLKHRFRTYQI